MAITLSPGILYYILSSDKRAIIVGHLLEESPLRNRELFENFNDWFPDLADQGFFGKSHSIGQIIEAIAGDDKDPQLVAVETEPEFAYGKEVDVMYSALTDGGVIAQPYLRFGLEFAYKWGDCLMATLGYEKGGAPKTEVAQNRIDILKYIAQTDAPASIYEIAEATDMSIRDALRHCKYMSKGGALKLVSERPDRDTTKRLFEFAGTSYSDNMDFDPLDHQVSRNRVKAIIDTVRRDFRKGDILNVDAIFGHRDCPRSERSRYCLLNFLLENEVLIKRTQGTTTVLQTTGTKTIVRSLVVPIEMALQGNRTHRREIERLARVNRRNKKHVIDVGKRFLKYYKHSRRRS